LAVPKKGNVECASRFSLCLGLALLIWNAVVEAVLT